MPKLKTYSILPMHDMNVIDDASAKALTDRHDHSHFTQETKYILQGPGLRVDNKYVEQKVLHIPSLLVGS